MPWGADGHDDTQKHGATSSWGHAGAKAYKDTGPNGHGDRRVLCPLRFWMWLQLRLRLMIASKDESTLQRPPAASTIRPSCTARRPPWRAKDYLLKNGYGGNAAPLRQRQRHYISGGAAISAATPLEPNRNMSGNAA